MSTLPNTSGESAFNNDWPLRAPALVMDIDRLGSLHQSRLSFMRLLVRRMIEQQWQISTQRFDLDDQGLGTVVYSLLANGSHYSFVIFSHYLDDEERNDRVIAEKWDVTMALCIGEVSDEQIETLRQNVPKQEGGRYDANVMVLSRGNKSSRNFEYVMHCLSEGKQPDPQVLAKVGYLYRTTAVYGSGKFGMADWYKVRSRCEEFASPFAAEMFSCYLLRHFSLQQVQFLAHKRNPSRAVELDLGIQRFFGIGNSTGLGMAPYLIRHPMLISQWILTREKAIARVINEGEITPQSVNKLITILQKAATHVSETSVPDENQIARNQTLHTELVELIDWFSQRLDSYPQENKDWKQLVQFAVDNLSLETQEMVNSALMEVHPELIDSDEQYGCVEEEYRLVASMQVSQLREQIERHYDWALKIDFTKPSANHFFWYRSEEKMEPRLGQRYSEPGADKEMPLTIARLVRECYDLLIRDIDSHGSNQRVAFFLSRHPGLTSIVKRIQTMSQQCYGEIRANLADVDMLPMDLLRCKLSFFGVSKFDPKSKLWVRNTMFQGAPVVAELLSDSPPMDDWYFPIMPGLKE